MASEYITEGRKDHQFNGNLSQALYIARGTKGGAGKEVSWNRGI